MEGGEVAVTLRPRSDEGSFGNSPIAWFVLEA